MGAKVAADVATRSRAEAISSSGEYNRRWHRAELKARTFGTTGAHTWVLEDLQPTGLVQRTRMRLHVCCLVLLAALAETARITKRVKTMRIVKVIEVVHIIYGKCESQVWCGGTLLKTMQLSGYFNNSRTFVNLCQKKDESVTVERFTEMMDRTKNSPTHDDIGQFIEEYFDSRSELVKWTPPDWTSSPAAIASISDTKLRAFALSLHEVWKELGRMPSKDVRDNPTRHSLIYVPHGTFVPDVKRSELYHWDSYFVVLGALRAGMYQSVRGMLQNFVDFVKQYGHLAHGLRVHHLTRDSPSLLIMMVDSYLKATNDYRFVYGCMDVLHTEFDYIWSTFGTKYTRGNKTYEVARYKSDFWAPRPDEYEYDWRIAQTLKEEEREPFWGRMNAATTSGWAQSSRWIRKPRDDGTWSITDIQPQKYIAVDLIAILEAIARLLAKWNNDRGDSRNALKYRLYSTKMQKSMRDLLWNDELGSWFDYNMEEGKQETDYYATNFYPLWTQSYDSSQSVYYGKKTLVYIKQLGLQYHQGLPMSLTKSGMSADWPSICPCHEYILMEGLQKTKYRPAQILAEQFALTALRRSHASWTKYGGLHKEYHAEKIGETISVDALRIGTSSGPTLGVVYNALATWSNLPYGTLTTSYSKVFYSEEITTWMLKYEIYTSASFYSLHQKHEESVIISSFQTMLTRTKNEPTKEDVAAWCAEYFEEVEEFEEYTPVDWQPDPGSYHKVKDYKVRAWMGNMNEGWKTLAVRIKEEVRQAAASYSVIPIKSGFIRPTAQSKELYNWDTYWILVGLIHSHMTETAKDMILSLLWVVTKYRFLVPGGRIHNIEDVQLSMLALIMHEYVQATNDTNFMKEHYPTLEIEMNHLYERLVTDYVYKEKRLKVVRYTSTISRPRLGHYQADFAVAQTIEGKEEQTKWYQQMNAAQNSIWGMSSRWFRNKTADGTWDLTSIYISDLLTPCAHSIFHKHASILAYYAKEFGYVESEKKYSRMALEMRTTLQLMYNEQDGLWYDWDTKYHRQTGVFTLASFTPLYYESYDVSQKTVLVKRAAEFIKKKKLLSYSGLPATLEQNGMEVDYQVYPAHQVWVVQAMRSINDETVNTMAETIATNCMSHIYRGYMKHEGLYGSYSVETLGETAVVDAAPRLDLGKIIGVIIALFIWYPWTVLTSLTTTRTKLYEQVDMIRTVQSFKIWSDTSYFYRLRQVHDESIIISKWNELQVATKSAFTKEQVETFVSEHFTEATEVETIEVEWKSATSVLEQIRDGDLHDWCVEIEAMWKGFFRIMAEDVMVHPPRFSLIAVEHPYPLSDLRYVTLYSGWRTYWEMRGLLVLRKFDLVKKFLLNVISIISTYGRLPWGGRIYHLNRPLPAFMLFIARLYCEYVDDWSMMKEYLSIFEMEVDYSWSLFVSNYTIDGKSWKFARYFSRNDKPRIEHMEEDIAAASVLPEEERPEMYRQLNAMEVAGWGPTSRFILDEDSYVLHKIKTTYVAAVELQSALIKQCRYLAEYNRKWGSLESAVKYDGMADDLQSSLDTYMWSEEHGTWFDFNLIAFKRIAKYRITNFSPLFFEVFDLSKKEYYSMHTLAYMQSTKILQYDGGPPMTLAASGWRSDFPTVSPEHHLMMTYATRNLATESALVAAKDCATTYLSMTHRSYKLDGGYYEIYHAEVDGGPAPTVTYSAEKNFATTFAGVIVVLNDYPSMFHGVLITSHTKVYTTNFEAIKTVAMAKVVTRTVDFVQLSMKYSEEEIYANYYKFMVRWVRNPNSQQVSKWVEENYEVDEPLDDWTPADWKEEPAVCHGIRDVKYRDFIKSVHIVFSQLGRKISDKVREHPLRHSTIAVPNAFIAASDEDEEIWDRNIQMRSDGLLLAGMHDTCRGVLENYIWVTQNYGSLLWGGRAYYRRRSQPPVLIGMLEKYARITKHTEFISKNMHTMQVMYDDYYAQSVTDYYVYGNTYKIVRYPGRSDEPRVEEYREDIELSRMLAVEKRRTFFQQVHSASVSGYGFSSRFFEEREYYNVTEVATSDYALPCLTSKMEYWARTLAKWCEERGYKEAAARYWRHSEDFKYTLARLLWSKKDGCWFAWNVRTKQLVREFYPENLTPLQLQSYDTRRNIYHVKRIVTYLKRTGVLAWEGGAPASTFHTGHRWDWPNVHPESQVVMAEALHRASTIYSRAVGRVIARKFIRTVYHGWTKYKFLFESYDATLVGGPPGAIVSEEYDGYAVTVAALFKMAAMYPDLQLDDTILLDGEAASESVVEEFADDPLVARRPWTKVETVEFTADAVITGAEVQVEKVTEVQQIQTVTQVQEVQTVEVQEVKQVEEVHEVKQVEEVQEVTQVEEVHEVKQVEEVQVVQEEKQEGDKGSSSSEEGKDG